ncbi:MAG: cephalosporin hydroxylase family protein [Gammaproteobacteria bacterium]|nr:cephalosporin hydroxylase family protein [Gammaproteobacteria bacterium]
MSKLIIDTDNISDADADEILRLANIIYFQSKAYERTNWMGVPAAKCPMDMWIYQELMFALKTDLLIETGTLSGGSALFFAQMFELMGKGQVVSVDINLPPTLPQHPRISYLQGSSIDAKVLDQVGSHAEQARSVTVILDSDHAADYKLKELEAYSEFVSRGNYIIAEDSCFDYFPAWPEYGPGPATAVKAFMENRKNFKIDRFPELHLITFAPQAFLKRLS